jgi:hypothetical protein
LTTVCNFLHTPRFAVADGAFLISCTADACEEFDLPEKALAWQVVMVDSTARDDALGEPIADLTVTVAKGLPYPVGS